MRPSRSSTPNSRSLVIVGQRAGGSALYDAVVAEGIFPSVALTGDANAPGAIAHAVYQGHRTAREIGAAPREVLRDAPYAMRDIAAPREAAE